MNFKSRQDRFDFFSQFESPALNITFRLEVPNFIQHAKEKGLPPFHYFLYHVCQSILEIEPFCLRVIEGEVVTMDELISSYTVLNEDKNLNFTHVKFNPNLAQFINESLEAKKIAESSTALINTGHEQNLYELKKYVFFTSLPWLDFTSVQHPAFSFKNPDIPSISWGKFILKSPQTIEMGFSVQAHHGLIDGYHIQLLAQKIKENILKAQNQ